MIINYAIPCLKRVQINLFLKDCYLYRIPFKKGCKKFQFLIIINNSAPYLAVHTDFFLIIINYAIPYMREDVKSFNF